MGLGRENYRLEGNIRFILRSLDVPVTDEKLVWSSLSNMKYLLHSSGACNRCAEYINGPEKMNGEIQARDSIFLNHARLSREIVTAEDAV